MFNGSFRNIRSRLRENALGHIADDLRFTAFITLEHSHRALFGGMRTPSRPTPDMYGPFASSSRSRRPINLRFSTRVTRVTTYSEGSTQKSPSGCIKGRKGKWLKHQNIWTKNNCAQRQEICDRLPKSLVVGFVSKRLNIQWLEQPEEDFLAYESGNQVHQNSPHCILDKVEIVRDTWNKIRFVLCRRTKTKGLGKRPTESRLFVTTLVLDQFLRSSTSFQVKLQR